jgi:ferric-dicitrate binding protein FerR (iron transport regulator)
MHDISIELFEKFLKNKTKEVETKMVTDWLKDNNLSRQDIEYYIKHPERFDIFSKIKVDDDWQLVSNEIAARRKSYNMRSILKYAASIAIVAAISGTSLFFYKYLNQPTIVYNYNPALLRITLPDNSNVCLGRNSKLIFKNSFLKKREVVAEGLLYFQIKRDANHPFVIKTQESNIKVLGTSFTVQTEKQNTSVIVTSGRVAFYTDKKKCDTLFLTKGDEGIYKNKSLCLEKSTNKDLNFLAWENHQLIFKNTPMSKVISDLERYFNIKINIVNPEILKYKYTTEFSNPSLNAILKEIELVLFIDVKKIGNNVIFKLKK